MSGSHVTGSKVTELLSCTNDVTWDHHHHVGSRGAHGIKPLLFLAPKLKLKPAFVKLSNCAHCRLRHCHHALLSLLLFSLH